MIFVTALGWTFLILIALIAAGFYTGIVKITKHGKPWPNRE